ncbi:MAG: AAA family ATPase [Methyloglobulus sp.]|nr:AAA family ATPase [Methyloglobulus sp.]
MKNYCTQPLNLIDADCPNPVKTLLNTQIKSSASGYLLISRERTQKLELLNHLIANLAHAIIVCGPEGIGKTLLLESFQERTIESWIFCWVKADSKLSLERIQEQIGEKITQKMPDFKFQSLAEAFDKMANWGMKIVLVIDNAGNLAPGLVEKIISYTENKPVVRIIFALTHSELYLKSGTDPAIEDCYQIEIPPLSEKQCGEYLEYLSTLPKPRIQFSAINESMVAELYRETHGIPGKILAQLPASDIGKKTDYSKAILILAVIGLILVALGSQWWSARQKIDSDNIEIAEKRRQPGTNSQQALVTPQAVSAQVKQPVAISPLPEPQVQQEIQESADTLNTDKSVAANHGLVNDGPGQMRNDPALKHDDTGKQLPDVNLANTNSAQPQASSTQQLTGDGTTSGQVQVDEQPIPLGEGGHWLMEQPIENYTLQLMALPKEQAIIEVLQRHQGLGQNLRYVKTKTRTGKDRFVLVYGSFSSPEQAKIEGQNLPKELQKTWMRKIGAVQKEVNISTQADMPG